MTEYVTVWKDDEPTKVRRNVPVVRCKDCKYLIAHGSGCAYWDFCDIEDTSGFCAWGERREA